MDERKKKILKAVVREYGRTGQAVASQSLIEKHRFRFSPATIRYEMKELDEEGFLEQPHTSAGRLPTDKTFRLLLRDLLDDDLGAGEQRQIFQYLDRIGSHSDSMVKSAAKILAEISNHLGISGFINEDTSNFYEAGLSWLMREPELVATEDFESILKFVDSLEDEFNDFFSDIDENVEIFIGDENPIKYLRSCSLMIVGFNSLHGEKGILGILGPKRMDYRRNKFILEEMVRHIKE